MTLSQARVRLLRRISTRKGREKAGVVLLEGPRVTETAFEHGAEILFAVVTAESLNDRSQSVLERFLRTGVEVAEVERGLFTELTQTQSPQGLLALAREPRPALEAPARRSGTLVLDAVQDPGNVGALVRAAAALDVARVLVLDGTADEWGAKAVRASAGLAFSLPVHRLGWESALGWLQDSGQTLLVADPRGEDVRRYLQRHEAERGTPPGEGRWALLLANEAAGPRQEALSAAHAVLSIPLRADVESMNVATAAAILLWALGPGGRREPGGKP